MNNKIKLVAAIASAIALSQSQAMEINQSKGGITFTAVENAQSKITLISPSNERYIYNFSGPEFVLDAKKLGINSFETGRYKYEISPVNTADGLGSDVRKLNDENLNKEYKESFSNKDKLVSGFFSIENNQLLDRSEEEQTLLKDQVIVDDLIVDGSACIGFDCVNGESFGFDTIRLKENNLRIKFDDTSVAVGFPANDWQITANESANGGANKFSIDDISGGRTPFTVEAGAPSHSLYVDDGGRIGNGTSTPSVEIHTVDGDTPTLRLQQDGSSGFAPQTWDVAGNETSFFIRDVTNGSTLPFRIFPDAPSNSLNIESSTGHIGVGTTSPDAVLHIERGGSGADGLPRVMFDNTDFANPNAANGDWIMDMNDNGVFRITLDGSGSQEMQLDTSGNLTVTGTVTTATQTLPDYVFEKDYSLMTLKELKLFIQKEKHLPGVPNQKQVLSDQKGQYNMTEMQMAILEKVEELTLYTLAQEDSISSLEAKIKELEAKEK